MQAVTWRVLALAGVALASAACASSFKLSGRQMADAERFAIMLAQVEPQAAGRQRVEWGEATCRWTDERSVAQCSARTRTPGGRWRPETVKVQRGGDGSWHMVP